MTDQELSELQRWAQRVRQIAEFSRENALARGFEPRTWANLPGSLALVITELDEMVDAPGPQETAFELADAGLRLLGIMDALYPHRWSIVRHPSVTAMRGPVEVTLWPIIHCMRRALAAWRRQERDKVLHWLEQMFGCIYRASEVFKIDLVEAMSVKSSQNALREPLHGALETL